MNNVFITLLILVPFLTSCSKASMGGGLGAGLGLAAGSQIGDGKGRLVAMVAGGILGGFAGAEIGHYLDEMDKQKIADALDQRRASAWSARDGGRVEVVPVGLPQSNSRGEKCQEGKVTRMMPDGKVHTFYPTYCREAA